MKFSLAEKHCMKHNKKPSKDILIWLDFALYDLKSATWQLEGTFYTSACFAAQQSAEKALKAFILYNGIRLPKSHSLDRLLSILKEQNIDVSFIETPAKTLDIYYITTRYPGQYGGPEGLYDKTDAKEAIKSAQAILTNVQTHISDT